MLAYSKELLTHFSGIQLLDSQEQSSLKWSVTVTFPTLVFNDSTLPTESYLKVSFWKLGTVFLILLHVSALLVY